MNNPDPNDPNNPNGPNGSNAQFNNNPRYNAPEKKDFFETATGKFVGLLVFLLIAAGVVMYIFSQKSNDSTAPAPVVTAPQTTAPAPVQTPPPTQQTQTQTQTQQTQTQTQLPPAPTQLQVEERKGWNVNHNEQAARTYVANLTAQQQDQLIVRDGPLVTLNGYTYNSGTKIRVKKPFLETIKGFDPNKPVWIACGECEGISPAADDYDNSMGNCHLNGHKLNDPEFAKLWMMTKVKNAAGEDEWEWDMGSMRVQIAFVQVKSDEMRATWDNMHYATFEYAPLASWSYNAYISKDKNRLGYDQPDFKIKPGTPQKVTGKLTFAASN